MRPFSERISLEVQYMEQYITEMEWNGWYFEIQEDKKIFGKTAVEVSRDDIEEVFYIEEEYLTEKVCQRVYDKYLYAYGI